MEDAGSLLRPWPFRFFVGTAGGRKDGLAVGVVVAVFGGWATWEVACWLLRSFWVFRGVSLLDWQESWVSQGPVAREGMSTFGWLGEGLYTLERTEGGNCPPY